MVPKWHCFPLNCFDVEGRKAADFCMGVVKTRADAAPTFHMLASWTVCGWTQVHFEVENEYSCLYITIWRPSLPNGSVTLEIQSIVWKGRFPIYLVFWVNIQLSNSTSFSGMYYRQCWVKTLLYKMFFIFRLQTDEEREKNGSEEDDDEKPGKRVIGPRKKFHWDDTIR